MTLCDSPLIGQTYSKQLVPSANISQQIVRQFTNGDLLVGATYLDTDNQSDLSGIILTRIDLCGFQVWSNHYHLPSASLQLNDFVISNDDVILILGSYLVGLDESYFLMEVSELGVEQRFRVYNADSPGTSSFSISLRGNEILVSGRILEIGQETTGYIAVFDRQFNFQQARQFTPSTFDGTSLIASDGSYLVRSEAFHYKFDGRGNLDWALEFDRRLAARPIAGPIEVQGGFLYQAHDDQEAFFYKLSPEGTLVWQGPRFPCLNIPAAFSQLPGGTILAHYLSTSVGGDVLVRTEFAADGSVLNQFELVSSQDLDIGSISHSLQELPLIQIVGSSEGLSITPSETNNYLIQYNLDIQMDDCHLWEQINTHAANTVALSFPILSTAVVPFSMETVPSASIQTTSVEQVFDETCGTSIAPQVIEIDTFLQCNENWLVALVDDGFLWRDNFPNTQRSLSIPGIYEAYNQDCSDPIVYQYQLESAICDCDIYVPNVFSPNDDGINDQLEFFTDCEVLQLASEIYDRWGNRVFSGRSMQELWNGLSNAMPAAAGVYTVKVSYDLLSSTAGMQNGSLLVDVTLVR